jgi:hypothetical protein
MDFYALSTNRILAQNEIIIRGDDLLIRIEDDSAPDRGTHVFNGEFKISELIQNFSQDHGCIAIFPENFVLNAKMIAVETTQLSLPHKTGFNLSQNTSETLPGKQMAGSPFHALWNMYGSYAFLYILTPHKGCNANDLSIIYRDTSGVSISVNGAGINSTKINSTKMFLDAWLPITISGPDEIVAGETAEFSVSSVENVNIYVSADIGILNRSKVMHEGSFKLNTDGLEVGETITIKAGYKFWTSKSTKTITII